MTTSVKSGIYEIRNKITGHCYIGSSIDVRNRRYRHVYALRRGEHHSPVLQNAWNKYGEDSFEFLLIEEVPDRSLLIQREQYWIDTRRPKYNINQVAESRLGLKNTAEQNRRIAESHKGMKHKPESLEKMRAAKLGGRLTEEHKHKISKAGEGRTYTSEQVARIAASNRAVWAKKSAEEKHRIATNRPPISEETRQRMRDSHKGYKQTPESLAKQAATWEAKSEEEKAASAAKKQSTWASKSAEELALIAEKKRATRAARLAQQNNS